MISVTITQLCHCSIKTAINNMQINKHGCLPEKHCLQKQGVSWIWLAGIAFGKSVDSHTLVLKPDRYWSLLLFLRVFILFSWFFQNQSFHFQTMITLPPHCIMYFVSFSSTFRTISHSLVSVGIFFYFPEIFVGMLCYFTNNHEADFQFVICIWLKLYYCPIFLTQEQMLNFIFIFLILQLSHSLDSIDCVPRVMGICPTVPSN